MSNCCDKEFIEKQEENTKRIERLAIELAEQEIAVDLETINQEEGAKTKKEEKKSAIRRITIE